MTETLLPIGLVQMAGTGTLEENLDKALTMAREAKARGARLVCFPELFACPWFARVEDPAGLRYAEPMDGPTTRAARAFAREEGLILLVSFFERAGGRYYNTAVLVGPDGSTLGTYRKNHIPDARGFYEARYYGPGDLGLPVFDTPVGRIGVQVCSDIMIPEATRVLGLKGAELVLILCRQPQGVKVTSRIRCSQSSSPRGLAIGASSARSRRSAIPMSTRTCRNVTGSKASDARLE